MIPVGLALVAPITCGGQFVGGVGSVGLAGSSVLAGLRWRF